MCSEYDNSHIRKNSHCSVEGSIRVRLLVIGNHTVVKVQDVVNSSKHAKPGVLNPPFTQ